MSEPHPYKARKPGQAPVVCASIAVSHPAAQRRRLVAVCVTVSRPELEALTCGHLYQQGAQPPGVLPLPGRWPTTRASASSCVLSLMRSSLRPDRYSELPLCSISPSPPERTVRCNRACKAASVATRSGAQPAPSLLNEHDQRFQGSQAFVEHTAVGGQVKHHEAHLSPRGSHQAAVAGWWTGHGQSGHGRPTAHRPWAWWASLR